MSNILEKIVIQRRKRIAQLKEMKPVRQLEASPLFGAPVLSLTDSLKHPMRTAIIAEFKKASPSKGPINTQAQVEDVYAGYAQWGASGVSILTEPDYFMGSDADLQAIMPQKSIPVLRKDFTIDEYQIIEAKALGADAILLIAACLSPAEVKKLASLARSLKLEVLLELHNECELNHDCEAIDLIGINNRDLKTFSVDWAHSISLAAKLPAEKPKIAESGIDSPQTLFMLKKEGFDGFLIGENFMKNPDPTIAFAAFVHQLQALAPATAAEKPVV